MNAATNPPGSADMVGRTLESHAIDEAFDAMRSGHTACLVFHGEPGIGKSRLLQYAVEKAVTERVLMVTGTEFEAQMAFAGLHRLLRPLLGRIDELPAPQRMALQAAFGLVASPPPDRFLVGLGVLDAAVERGDRPTHCRLSGRCAMDRRGIA